MKSHVRAFVAIDIAPSVRAQARKALRPMMQSFPNVKWVDNENFHVTLKFLGPNVPTNELHNVIAAIQRACRNFEQFDLVFEGMGAFPDSSNPRTVWIGVSDGVNELRTLAKRIDEEMEKIGFPSENRQFSPHLTVGRARQRDRNEGEFASKTQRSSESNRGKSTRDSQNDRRHGTQEDEFEPGTFSPLARMLYDCSNLFFGSSPVDTVTLYSSELERNGPKYEPIAEIELAPLGSVDEQTPQKFDVKEFDDPDFSIDENEMEGQLPEVLDTKLDVDALDAEVEDELRAICGDKFAKRKKKFSAAPKGAVPNRKELKKKLTDAADSSGPETDSADLFGYSVFRETNPLNRKKKK